MKRSILWAAMMCLAILLLAAAAPCALAQSSTDGNAIINAMAQSVLELKVYGPDGDVKAEGIGLMVFDKNTLAVPYHLLAGAYKVEAVSQSGEPYQVTKVAAVDEKRDVALLKFDSPTDIGPLPLATAATSGPKLFAGWTGDPDNYYLYMAGIKSIAEENGVSMIRFSVEEVSEKYIGGMLLSFMGNFEVAGMFLDYDSADGTHLAVDIAEIIKLHEESQAAEAKPLPEVFADSP